MITVEFDRLRLQPGDRILDLGCGSGRHMGELVCRRGVLACGCDKSLTELANARKRIDWLDEARMVRADWTLMGTDITSLPFRDNVFDLVICSEVLEHVPDHDTAASELVRVLKPGAPLVVSVPRSWPERICWGLSRDYRTAPGGHVRIYRTRALVSLLSRQGLLLTARHYAHAFHAPYWWLKCFLGLENTDAPAVCLYHRFLCWEMMNPRPSLKFLEKLINPLLGKSIVIYLTKKKNLASNPMPSVK